MSTIAKMNDIFDLIKFRYCLHLCQLECMCVPLSNVAEDSCTSVSCHSKNKEVNTGEESKMIQDSSVAQDGNSYRDEWMQVKKENAQLGHDITQERKSVKETIEEKETGSKDREASLPHVQPGSTEKLEGMDDPNIH